MPRALQLGAGLGLALVILTCTNEPVTGPTRPGRLALDIHALMAGAPGQPDIPIDSLRITLRRPSLDDVFLKLTGRAIRDEEAGSKDQMRAMASRFMGRRR